jgi:hypothetical protein
MNKDHKHIIDHKYHTNDCDDAAYKHYQSENGKLQPTQHTRLKTRGECKRYECAEQTSANKDTDAAKI